MICNIYYILYTIYYIIYTMYYMAAAGPSVAGAG